MKRRIRTYSTNEKLVNSRRAQIALCAAGIFARKGYHDTIVREIGDACGMGKGTIYHYIGAKEDILSLIREQGEAMWEGFFEENLANFDNMSATKILKHSIEGFYRRVDKYADITRFWYQEIRHASRQDQKKLQEWDTRAVALFEKILTKGCMSGEFKVDNITMVSHTIVVGGEMWAVKRWFLRKHFTLEEYISVQVKMTLRLVCADECIVKAG